VAGGVGGAATFWLILLSLFITEGVVAAALLGAAVAILGVFCPIFLIVFINDELVVAAVAGGVRPAANGEVLPVVAGLDRNAPILYISKLFC
jgi:hypothetical protein